MVFVLGEGGAEVLEDLVFDLLEGERGFGRRDDGVEAEEFLSALEDDLLVAGFSQAFCHLLSHGVDGFLGLVSRGSVSVFLHNVGIINFIIGMGILWFKVGKSSE